MVKAFNAELLGMAILDILGVNLAKLWIVIQAAEQAEECYDILITLDPVTPLGVVRFEEFELNWN